ncbi:MAG: anhydro-N-acetylmuramic acid kinase [Cyclobacteriaceae bacterium]
MKNLYRAIGIMSGSSLDGLDICLSSFSELNNSWDFEIERATTTNIPEGLKEQLRNSTGMDAEALEALDIEYGIWVGEAVKQFIHSIKGEIDLVALHGHTVFHEPAQGISKQLGKGALVAEICGIDVVDDFRIDDIRLGGQGAPLVPVGEYHLFKGFEGFVNLGGIANISVLRGDEIKAWDICPCNQVLNYFSAILGKSFDDGGALAKAGEINQSWLEGLQELDFFQKEGPKSLSNQWGYENIINRTKLDASDVLRTYTQLITDMISSDISRNVSKGSKVLFTGGGAYNSFLIELMKHNLSGDAQVSIPEKDIIEFKEALIFGFLGLLKKLGRPNVFASVTGATADSVSGTIHKP